MPKKGIEKEKVTLALPIGMNKRAKELGINMSFHATQAIQKEIERVEQYRN